jgi:hypothetical protein
MPKVDMTDEEGGEAVVNLINDISESTLDLFLPYGVVAHFPSYLRR